MTRLSSEIVPGHKTQFDVGKEKVMTMILHQNIKFGYLPYWATKVEANHRFGIDLESHLSKRNLAKKEPTDNKNKTTVIQESEFSKLLRTELKKPLNQSKNI